MFGLSASMLWHIYLRKGQVFIPTVSKTDAGFHLDVKPVAVHKADDFNGIGASIEAAIERGNPIVPTPSRGSFPVPVVLEYANVKSWATFEKSAVCWMVRLNQSAFQLCPLKLSPPRGWVEDPATIETYTAAHSIARRIAELIGQAEGKE